MPPPLLPLKCKRVYSEISSKQLCGHGGSIQSIKGQATTSCSEPQLWLHFFQRLENRRQTFCCALCPQLTAALRKPSSAADGRLRTAALQHFEQREASSVQPGGEWYKASLGHTKDSVFMQSLRNFLLFFGRKIIYIPQPQTHTFSHSTVRKSLFV